MELVALDSYCRKSCLIRKLDRRIGYRNSALYTLKYVAEMLGEDEDFLHDCSIEMFSEDGCLSAYDSFPATELSEPIVVFTEDGIDSLKYIIEARREAGDGPPKPTEETRSRNHSRRGLHRTDTVNLLARDRMPVRNLGHRRTINPDR